MAARHERALADLELKSAERGLRLEALGYALGCSDEPGGLTSTNILIAARKFLAFIKDEEPVTDPTPIKIKSVA